MIARLTFLTVVGLGLATTAHAQVENFYPVTPNGYRVFLSPATHSGLGGGGCLNGNEGAYENNMAYLNARDAAGGFHGGGVYADSYQDLTERGYWVQLSTGTNQEKINQSNAFGATVHLPVHSNGGAGLECSSTNAAKFGTWGMYRPDSTSQNLADWLRYYVGPGSPGTGDKMCAVSSCSQYSTLAELEQTTAYSRAYLEQEFHSWDTGARWLLQDLSWQWRISAAIDGHLGSPR